MWLTETEKGDALRIQKWLTEARMGSNEIFAHWNTKSFTETF